MNRQKERGLTWLRSGTLNANKDDLTVCVFEQDWRDAQGALTLDILSNRKTARFSVSAQFPSDGGGVAAAVSGDLCLRGASCQHSGDNFSLFDGKMVPVHREAPDRDRCR